MVASAEEAFPLLDGDRRAVIVGSSQFLLEAVERCTGVRLRLVAERDYKKQALGYPIYIGDTHKAREVLAKEIASLDAEGYVFLVRPDLAIIYASGAVTDTGTPLLYAEANFARQFLAVDQYFPGELGLVYPRQERITIPCGLHVENPAFEHRHWSGYSGAAGPAWRLRASGGGGRYQFHHSLYKIIDPVKYGDHPDYFPMRLDRRSGRIEDTRYIPTDNFSAYWQPCTSNPAVLDITVKTILGAFAATPGLRSYSLGVNDSGGYCLCPECQKITPEGYTPQSDEAIGYRFYKFYNEVAERVARNRPDARLGFLVYSALSKWYPEKLHPCLMPYLTLSFADCWDAEYKRRIYAHIDRWSRIAPRFGIYEWYHGQGFFIPRIYLREMAEGLRHAHATGAEGFYAEAYANWGLDGPKLWVTEKLLWNPKQDVGKLIDTYCRGLFGEAAEEMRAYFAFLETAWATQKPSNDKRGGYRLLTSLHKKPQFTEVFSPAVCDAAWALLEKSEAAARTEMVRTRIAYFRDSFGATRLASTRLQAGETMRELLEADRAPALEGQEKKQRSVVDWLIVLEAWARFPSLDDYMTTIRDRAPWSFQEFCEDAIKSRGKSPERQTRTSFAAWDTDAPALRPIVDLVTDAVIATDPANAEQFNRQVLTHLSDWGEQAKRNGRFCDHAVGVLRPLCTRVTMDGKRLASAPKIDGTISKEEWGDPQLDGSLYRYPLENTESGDRTRVWVGVSGDKLFAAFHCYQDPDTVLNKVTERDVAPMHERGVIDHGRPFPYLGEVDSVGVSAWENGWVVAIVTSGGGLFDGKSTPKGYIPDWNGAVAAVRKTEDGWAAELSMQISNPDALVGAVKGFNFFRVRNGVRSAWVPGQPQRWALAPNRAGILFFPQQ